VDLRQRRDWQDRLRECLDSEERRRASRFHFQRDRDRFVTARGSLRHILARYLDRRPETLRLGYGEAGKPFLPDHPDLQFNLSHAADLLLVGVSHGRRLGVDIERVAPDSVIDATSGLVFSEPEIAMLRQRRGPARRERFARFWTRKEAYIKADGRGMGLELRLIDVATEPDHVLLRDESSGRWTACPRWRLHSMVVDRGYAAALAVEGDDWRPASFNWPGSLMLAG
jgi:4'-phosphopantetheinyl transferase